MQPGAFYHIYNRTNNKELLFKEKANYSFFLRQLVKYTGPYVEVYAYCLMPTHFHLLVRVKALPLPGKNGPENQIKIDRAIKKFTKQELAFKNLFISYVKAVNKKYDRHGSLFQHGYKRKLIDSGLYFNNAVAYIHYNPIEGKLASRMEDWTFSSYSEIVNPGPTFIKRKAMLEKFGGEEEFIKVHKGYGAYREAVLAIESL